MKIVLFLILSTQAMLGDSDKTQDRGKSTPPRAQFDSIVDDDSDSSSTDCVEYSTGKPSQDTLCRAILGSVDGCTDPIARGSLHLVPEATRLIARQTTAKTIDLPCLISAERLDMMEQMKIIHSLIFKLKYDGNTDLIHIADELEPSTNHEITARAGLGVAKAASSDAEPEAKSYIIADCKKLYDNYNRLGETAMDIFRLTLDSASRIKAKNVLLNWCSSDPLKMGLHQIALDSSTQSIKSKDLLVSVIGLLRHLSYRANIRRTPGANRAYKVMDLLATAAEDDNTLYRSIKPHIEAPDSLVPILFALGGELNADVACLKQSNRDEIDTLASSVSDQIKALRANMSALKQHLGTKGNQELRVNIESLIEELDQSENIRAASHASEVVGKSETPKDGSSYRPGKYLFKAFDLARQLVSGNTHESTDAERLDLTRLHSHLQELFKKLDSRIKEASVVLGWRPPVDSLLSDGMPAYAKPTVSLGQPLVLATPTRSDSAHSPVSAAGAAAVQARQAGGPTELSAHNILLSAFIFRNILEQLITCIGIETNTLDLSEGSVWLIAIGACKEFFFKAEPELAEGSHHLIIQLLLREVMYSALSPIMDRCQKLQTREEFERDLLNYVKDFRLKYFQTEYWENQKIFGLDPYAVFSNHYDRIVLKDFDIALIKAVKDTVALWSNSGIESRQ